MNVTRSSQYSVTPLRRNSSRVGMTERLMEAEFGSPSQGELEGTGIQDKVVSRNFLVNVSVLSQLKTAIE